jgi:hypothetical protein
MGKKANQNEALRTANSQPLTANLTRSPSRPVPQLAEQKTGPAQPLRTANCSLQTANLLIGGQTPL